MYRNAIWAAVGGCMAAAHKTSDWGKGSDILPAIRVLVGPRLEEDARIADPVRRTLKV
jgi:hypothetical protein